MPDWKHCISCKSTSLRWNSRLCWHPLGHPFEKAMLRRWAGFPGHARDPHEAGEFRHKWYNLYHRVLPADLIARMSSRDQWRLRQNSYERMGLKCSCKKLLCYGKPGITIKNWTSSQLPMLLCWIYVILLEPWTQYQALYAISVPGGWQPKRAGQEERWIFALGEPGIDNRSQTRPSQGQHGNGFANEKEGWKNQHFLDFLGRYSTEWTSNLASWPLSSSFPGESANRECKPSRPCSFWWLLGIDFWASACISSSLVEVLIYNKITPRIEVCPAIHFPVRGMKSARWWEHVDKEARTIGQDPLQYICLHTHIVCTCKHNICQYLCTHCMMCLVMYLQSQQVSMT